MKIVQISDLHITAWDKKTCGYAPTAENLSLCVEHINQLSPPVDVVLVTGDITNEGNFEEAEQAANILSKLICPFYIVPGNHDSRKIIQSAFDEQACPASANSEGFINYVIDDYAIRLIGLDSVQQGKSGGKVSKKRAKWLGECLTKDKDKPTIIFMHHPPVKCGVLETDVDGFKGAERLGNIIARHQNIERILCGHIHMQAHIRWKGTVITTAPSSTGMKIKLDLTQKKSSQFYLGAPSYLLHYWSPDKSLITHRINIDKLEGPYSFESKLIA